MTLLERARWQYDAYYRPERFDKLLSVDGVDVCLKFLADRTLAVFPGSRTAGDWWRDAQALIPIAHPILGRIPYGFSLGADAMHAALFPLLAGKPVDFIAHSLGCPHAIYQAGLLMHAGYPPEKISITGFEPPRACTQQLMELLAPVKDFTLTRNSDTEGHFDIVLELPAWAQHARELMQIGSEPISGNIIIDKEIHAIQAVMVSLELLEA